MILHRARPDFWISKSSALGNTKRRRRNAPPAWTPENRARAILIWAEETLGARQLAEMREAFLADRDWTEAAAKRAA